MYYLHEITTLQALDEFLESVNKGGKFSVVTDYQMLPSLRAILGEPGLYGSEHIWRNLSQADVDDLFISILENYIDEHIERFDTDGKATGTKISYDSILFLKDSPFWYLLEATLWYSVPGEPPIYVHRADVRRIEQKYE